MQIEMLNYLFGHKLNVFIYLIRYVDVCKGLYSCTAHGGEEKTSLWKRELDKLAWKEMNWARNYNTYITIFFHFSSGSKLLQYLGALQILRNHFWGFCDPLPIVIKSYHFERPPSFSRRFNCFNLTAVSFSWFIFYILKKAFW